MRRAYLAVSRAKRLSFWTVTGSVTDTAKAVWDSTSSRKTTRFAHSSPVKSAFPLRNTASLAADFLAMLLRGHIMSTHTRLRHFESRRSGKDESSAPTSRTSISFFIRLAISHLPAEAFNIGTILSKSTHRVNVGTTLEFESKRFNFNALAEAKAAHSVHLGKAVPAGPSKTSLASCLLDIESMFISFISSLLRHPKFSRTHILWDIIIRKFHRPAFLEIFQQLFFISNRTS